MQAVAHGCRQLPQSACPFEPADQIGRPDRFEAASCFAGDSATGALTPVRSHVGIGRPQWTDIHVPGSLVRYCFCVVCERSERPERSCYPEAVKSLLATFLAAAVAATTLMMAPLRAQDRVSVETAARSLQPGELAVLNLITASPVDALQVRAFNRDVKPFRKSPTEWQALVGIDLETKPGRHAISIVLGPLEQDRFTHRVTVAPKTFRTRELKVDPSFVNPPKDAQARIAADAERLRRVWTSSSAGPLWSGPFVRPVADPANSAFGTRSVFNGQPRSPHGGADFSSPAGTPVKSPNAGLVALAADLYFTGNTVVIDHGAGLFSLFAHLRTLSVRESDMVTTGAVVGEVGATGRVTGPHLHWAVRANDARVDPLSLLAVLGAESMR